MDALKPGVYYTAHYNWEPWLNLALDEATAVPRARELPSQRSLSKAERTPPSYALFRAEAVESIATAASECESNGNAKNLTAAQDGIEETNTTARKDSRLQAKGAFQGTHVRRAWATSRCAEQLDPKDNLFRLARDGGASLCFPPTRLLPYDLDLACGTPDNNSKGSNAVGASSSGVDSNSNGESTIGNPTEKGSERGSGKSDNNSTALDPPLVPPNGPRQLLKAPLGSGGNGLYFVDSDDEVCETS